MSDGISGTDVLFVLLGAILVFAMHAGFAFLEVGTVRRKNQVNALVKILADFGVSTVSYFFIGYSVAYGVDFLVNAAVLSGETTAEGYSFASNGYDLVKFFFLLTFAAAIPAVPPMTNLLSRNRGAKRTSGGARSTSRSVPINSQIFTRKCAIT